MPFKLPSSSGFPYRFGVYTGCSPYLKEYEPLLTGDSKLHRSRIVLNSVRKDVLEFGNNSKSLVDDPVFKAAVNNVRRKMRLPEPVKMVHFNDVLLKDLPIWQSSPGLPFRQQGFKTKREVRDNPFHVNNMRWFWHRVKCGDKMVAPDCCAYVRSHLARENENKTRAVWGYPMVMTIGEAIFALPLIKAFSRRDSTPIAYGYETALGGSRRITSRFAKRKNILAVDYSSFDKKLPAWLIKVAFDILEENIDFGNYQDYGTALMRGTLRQWEFIKRYFIETPIRLPNGERYLKNNGVASGSYFTQLIDSICNALIITYCCMVLTNGAPDDLLVFGDDSLFARLGLNLDEFAALSLEAFGMTVNVMKSGQSDRIENLEFLGYALTSGRPNKPFSKWIASLLYPEYPDTSWDMVCSRALGLMYANLGVNDLFHRLCYSILQTSTGCDLMLSRDMEKMLRLMGFKPIKFSFKDLPTPYDFTVNYLMR